MTGRRRHSRYLLTEPLDGHLRVREDVSIERWTDREVIVESTVPVRTDETLTLEVPGPAPRQFQVRLAESHVMVQPDGALRHRLRLVIQRDGCGGNGRQPL
jgi:hypothetical protein